ncbi:hypothetical protein [Nocardiopsis alborubida]|uniref:Uncharacterized protein n=1 Tax=Nocardiopsis alborubida TaxID=146802 RepID=A0A7X6RNY5_9ACTN|nr:hypothetical protein [Nocardiopsis alborubida]NKY96596.1 hypothetical protein [Nocardiopsis alborubida]
MPIITFLFTAWLYISLVIGVVTGLGYFYWWNLCRQEPTENRVAMRRSWAGRVRLTLTWPAHVARFISALAADIRSAGRATTETKKSRDHR